MPTKSSLPPAGTPEADIAIDDAAVRSLLSAQYPDLADLPIELIASGWDNWMFRLGDRLAVRLPRRSAAASLLGHEQRWLGDLALLLPLPVPAPVRIGQACEDFPWPWSIVPWLAGETADLDEPAADQGDILAGFLRALHRPAPLDAPRNPVRGCPLSERAAMMEQRMSRLTVPLAPEFLLIWQQALAAPAAEDKVWIHGDLHSRNVLVADGRLSAVIDWGDMAGGDRATDLAAIWILLADRTARQRAITAYDHPSPSCWARARGWALLLAVVFLDAGGVDDSRMVKIGSRILERLIAGPA